MSAVLVPTSALHQPLAVEGLDESLGHSNGAIIVRMKGPVLHTSAGWFAMANSQGYLAHTKRAARNTSILRASLKPK